MGKDVPLAVPHLLGVNGHHDALGTHLVRGFLDQIRVLHGGGVHGHLVRPRVEQAAHVRHAAHPAPHGKGDEDLGSAGFHHVENDVPLVRTGGNVQEGDFVRPLFIVAAGDFHRVPRIPQGNEVGAFNHPSGGHIQTGDDAFGQSHDYLAPLAAAA